MLGEGSCDLGTGRLHYRAAGEGPPRVVFLHGLLATSFCWRRSLRALAADGWAGAALDLPGIGGSAALGGEANLPRVAAAVAAFIDLIRDFTRDSLAPAAAPRDGVAVVGSSWGGAVALQLAADRPDLIARLALAAPVSPFFRANRMQHWLLRPAVARRGVPLLGRAPRRLYAAGLRRLLRGDPRLADATMLAGYQEPLRAPGLGRVIAGWVRNWDADLAALRPRLGEIRAPTLLLWGERDQVVPRASAAPLLAALPNARLETIPGAGHLSFEDQPDGFNAALRGFLRGD